MDEVNPRRWLLVAREVGVPGEEGGSNQWSLDHLFLDQNAIPTLIEVKRASDTRTPGGREVVGQMLDYAANAVVYWPVETIRARFEAASEQCGDESLHREILRRLNQIPCVSLSEDSASRRRSISVSALSNETAVFA